MLPQEYILVDRSVQRYTTGQFPVDIPIEGACFVSIEISAGEILIDNAESLVPVVSGATTYNGVRANTLNYPYLFKGTINIQEVTAATIIVNVWTPANVT